MFSPVLLSKEHHKWLSTDAPSYREVMICFELRLSEELILTMEACHDRALNLVSHGCEPSALSLHDAAIPP